MVQTFTFMNCIRIGLYSTFIEKIESNYCQNWQYLDKLSPIRPVNQIIAKNGNKLSQIIAKTGIIDLCVDRQSLLIFVTSKCYICSTYV